LFFRHLLAPFNFILKFTQILMRPRMGQPEVRLTSGDSQLVWLPLAGMYIDGLLVLLQLGKQDYKKVAR